MTTITNFAAHSVLGADNRTSFGGAGRLAGDPPIVDGESDGRAKVLNVPSRLNIVVVEPISLRVVARTLSRDDGSWQVPRLNEAMKYCVIGIDVTQQVNSAIQDWVYPVGTD